MSAEKLNRRALLGAAAGLVGACLLLPLALSASETAGHADFPGQSATLDELQRLIVPPRPENAEARLLCVHYHDMRNRLECAWSMLFSLVATGSL